MESNTPKTKSHATEYTVLPSSMSGGPKGLGDPDDRSVRTLEYELIYKRMREESKKMCPDENKVFEECMSNAGGLFFFKCRSANQELKNCQLKWVKDEDFKTKVTEQYLDDRSEYRRNGVTKSMREYEVKKEKEFEDWLKHHEKKETNVS